MHSRSLPVRSRLERRAPRPRLAALVACALAWGCAGPPAEPEAEIAPKPPSPLGAARQLTFDGLRSGEGYFSSDGSKLVFQSEREPGNPFYQIYVMDLETGGVLRASPGSGKTTCGFFHPSGARLLFSSTHLDPRSPSLQEQEIERRRQGKEQRYAWDYDPHYDVFGARLPPGDGALQRLTSVPGYDAEASWSPDGRQIVFASNRHAYQSDGSPSPSLSAAERAQLAADPSRFVDLYVMDSRGGNVRRLTDSPGYDGGPFFSPDGKQIVFRRFTLEGDRAEIFRMNADGSDVRPLTRLGAMSWAPFFHPSGDYVIFSTNLHGFENFELYLVDAAGTSDPVRVTEQDGFDGLPVFSPDGDEVVFTRKPPHGSSQLYRAAWDDDLARRRLSLPTRSFHAVGPLLPVPARLSPEIDPRELRTFTEVLTSDATEGRLTGSTGERIATSWVARVFRALGLEPAGSGDTYFHEFGFTAGVSLGTNNALRATLPGEPGARELVLDEEWRPLGFSRTGEIPDSEVVFAGYGIVAPAGDGQPAVDDYAHLDVTDRFVLVLRYLPELPESPESADEEARQRLSRYSSLRYKAMQARDRGARGILFVSGPRSQVREQLVPLRFDASLSGTSIAVASLSDATADRLLRAGSDRNLADLQAVLDRELAMPGFVLEGVRLGGTFDVQQQRKKGRNVIARLPASRPPAPGPDGAPAARLPAVVIGAHVDHLGRGEAAGSLARSDEATGIHRGADDNASGVAALLEIAGWLAREREAGRLESLRDVVFAAWSGEELGLLGSSAWVERELSRRDADPAGNASPEDLSPRVAAYLNLDMVGRLRDELTLFGANSSPVWSREVEQHNVPIGLPVALLGDSYLPTDATPFYLAHVPILSAFTGAHAEYHTPRDAPETLDYEGMARIASLFSGVVASLAGQAEAPVWLASAPPEHGMPRAGLRVYLGTIPDYSQSDARPGLKLAGVASGGPAEKAGLRAGDLVIEIDGRAIENIYDYTYSLDALKVGVPAKVVVERGQAKIAVMVTPVSRE